MKKIVLFTAFAMLLTAFNTAFSQSCTASFTYTTGSNGQLNLTSTSTGTSANTHFNWYLGNGNVISNGGQSVSYTYPYDGTYHVLLFIQDSGFVGSCSDSISMNIIINNAANAPCLPANFTYTVSGGTVNFSMTNPTPYNKWDFGDGTVIYNNSSPSHNYINNATYPVACYSMYNYSGNIYLTCDTVWQSVQITSVPCLSQFYVDTNYLGNSIIVYNASQGADSVFYSVNGGPHFAPTYASDTLTNLPAGSNTICQYIVGNGCTDSSCQTIMVNCSINVTYTTGCNQVSCSSNANQSITSAAWYVGGNLVSTQTNPVITFTNTSSFYVSYNLQTSLCQKNDSFLVQVGPSPSFYIWPDTSQGPHYWIVYVNNQANYTSYLWNWGDGTTSNTPYPTHYYSTPGWYTICLTITDNCGLSAQYCQNDSVYRSSSTMIGMTVQPENQGVGIHSVLTSDILIYPVPVSGDLWVENLSGHCTISLSDAEGRLILQQSNESRSKISLPMNEMASGFYILSIKSSQGVIQKKIIRQ